MNEAYNGHSKVSFLRDVKSLQGVLKKLIVSLAACTTLMKHARKKKREYGDAAYALAFQSLSNKLVTTCRLLPSTPTCCSCRPHKVEGQA